MTPLTIEDGIPIPPKRRRADGLTSVLRQMEVGQSTFVVTEKTGRVRSVAVFVAHGTGRTFTTRTFEGGVRIWRTA